MSSPRDSVSVDVKERLGKWRSAEEGTLIEERAVVRQAVDVPASTDVRLRERLQHWRGAEEGATGASAPARKEPIKIAEGAQRTRSGADVSRRDTCAPGGAGGRLHSPDADAGDGQEVVVRSARRHGAPLVAFLRLSHP